MDRSNNMYKKPVDVHLAIAHLILLQLNHTKYSPWHLKLYENEEFGIKFKKER